MGKSIYDSFDVDQQAQQEGAELHLGDVGKFRIAFAGATNKKFEKLVTARTKPFRRAIQTDSLDASRQNKILIDVYADCIILGWEEVYDREGNELPYSRENCIKLMTDLPILFKEIQDFATNHTVFRKELDEADAGNFASS